MNFDITVLKAFISQGEELSLKDSANSVVEVDGTPKLIVKYGTNVWKTEAITMQLVRERTNVPVPKFFAYLTEPYGKRSRLEYIVMEKVSGETLATVINDPDQYVVESIAKQLAKYLGELHKLDKEGWGLTGKKGMYHRTRFIYDVDPSRITSTKEFFNYFATAATTPLPEDHEEAKKLLSGVDLARPPVFSHGDLLPENIMYDRTSGHITAIIDWECAGCYPYFWNDFVARSRKGPRSTNWEEIYEYCIEDCYLASSTFTGYFYLADFNGSHDFSETK